MKRPIKFRGYDTADNVRDTITFTLDEVLADTDYFDLVDPNTVAQLVGYDVNGKEVYEGDEVVYLLTGATVKAEMTDIFVCHEAYRLKESDDD